MVYKSASILFGFEYLGEGFEGGGFEVIIKDLLVSN